MGRFTRTVRGFFGRFLSGVEQRNPEILLENAVQDELDNLKKLQVAAARTMAYEKMLTSDAAEKQKTVTARERQARELAARGQREAAIQVVQQKQEAQVGLEEIEVASTRPGATPRRCSGRSGSRSAATTISCANGRPSWRSTNARRPCARPTRRARASRLRIPPAT
jgi:hypothetical protein